MINRITPFLPAAANADPATSHEAADRVTRRGDRKKNCMAVLALVREHPGCTSVELFNMQRELDRHEISRRLADLCNANLAKKGEERECRIKGTYMLTWWPVDRQGKLF